MGPPNQEPTGAEASSNWRSKQPSHRRGDHNRQTGESSGHRSNESRRGSFQSTGSSSAQRSRDDENALQAIDEGRRIYVGNLLYHAKTEDVEALFASDEYQTERIVMSLDPFTGRNPSYCFVELATKEQADRAMELLNGELILGRPVKVKPCIPKKTEKTSGPASASNIPPNRWERTDAHEHWKGVAEEGRRLFVGGLAKPSSQADSTSKIAAIFEGFTL
jgi:RNA recognition motif-containing protein